MDMVKEHQLWEDLMQLAASGHRPLQSYHAHLQLFWQIHLHFHSAAVATTFITHYSSLDFHKQSWYRSRYCCCV